MRVRRPRRDSIRHTVCAVVRQTPVPAPRVHAARDAEARLWEVDAAWTLSIGLMVVYHVAYDVDLLAAEAALDLRAGAWLALQVTGASLFLALLGTSFWIAHQRRRSRGLSGVALWRTHARRGLEVLVAAALVSVATGSLSAPTTPSGSASCTSSRWRCWSCCRSWSGWGSGTPSSASPPPGSAS